MNSCFCYILKVPFDPKDKSGIIYVWIGKNSDSDDARVAEELVKVLFIKAQLYVRGGIYSIFPMYLKKDSPGILNVNYSPFTDDV